MVSYRRLESDQLAAVAVTVMVVGAIGVSLLNARTPDPIAKFVAVVGGGAYLATLFLSSAFRNRILLFLTLLILTGGTVAALAAMGVLGAGVLMFMPVVGLAAWELRWPGLFTVMGVSATQFLGSAWYIGSGGGLLAEAAIGFAAAIAFVIVFVGIAKREALARAEAESLNARLWEQLENADALATERERVRLAREIHDGLGHSLTSARVQLEVAERQLTEDREAAAAAIRTAGVCVAKGLADVRNSVGSLRQSPLDGVSLPEAVARLAADTSAPGLEVRYECRGAPRMLETAAALALYRAAQEGLSNVCKHAGARQAKVVLDFTEADRVRITVEDDGSGQAGDAIPGFGLIGLRERARLLDGSFGAGPSDAGGFRLVLAVPG